MSAQTEIKNLPEFLKSIFGEKIIIHDINSYNIVPPGENYGGEILAVDVTIEENGVKSTKNLIAKLKPSNEMLSTMFNIQFTFKREVNIYIDVIPTLINLQKEFNIAKEKIFDFVPKCFGARLNISNNNDVTNDALMLFENLKIQGYTMADRMEGLNLEQTEYFLKNLAYFHALPIALKILKPDIFKSKIESLNSSSFGDSYTDEMKSQFLNGLLQVITSIDDCKMYANKIVKLVDAGFKFEERFLKPNELYGTLVHHDLWINNYLIRFNKNNELDKIKIYDFQLASYGSFAHDLIFFLYTSVEQSIFDSNYNDLIKLYFDSFLTCLNDFNINTKEFTWQSFLNEINEIGHHQISHILIMMRPIFMKKNKINDNSEMNEKELGAIHELDSRYTIKLRKIILDFVQRKWL